MIQPVHPKGNQSGIFTGRTDAEVETPILWPPDAKNRLIGKDLDASKDWRWKEKVMTEDEMVGWHHQFDGHDFEQATWVGDGQGSLAYCSPWGGKKSDMMEWLNWIEGWVIRKGIFDKIVKVAQWYPTLCDPRDYTVHGILQARIVGWVTFPFFRGSSQPRDQTQVSHIAGGFFTSWATREAQE